jgi:hypothetical protein
MPQIFSPEKYDLQEVVDSINTNSFKYSIAFDSMFEYFPSVEENQNMQALAILLERYYKFSQANPAIDLNNFIDALGNGYNAQLFLVHSLHIAVKYGKTEMIKNVTALFQRLYPHDSLMDITIEVGVSNQTDTDFQNTYSNLLCAARYNQEEAFMQLLETPGIRANKLDATINLIDYKKLGSSNILQLAHNMQEEIGESPNQPPPRQSGPDI